MKDKPIMKDGTAAGEREFYRKKLIQLRTGLVDIRQRIKALSENTSDDIDIISYTGWFVLLKRNERGDWKCVGVISPSRSTYPEKSKTLFVRSLRRRSFPTTTRRHRNDSRESEASSSPPFGTARFMALTADQARSRYRLCQMLFKYATTPSCK